jgi:tripartite-type tricarboxylate transporter receptor subunit TctC
MRWRVAFSALALVLVPLSGAFAQNYPARPIKLIVPFPPGNASDVAARLLSERLQRRLGQPVIIENKPGGSGIVAVQSVTSAEPDGHTLLVTSLSPMVLNPALYKKLPYDTARDLAPVALIGYTALMFIANKDMPVNSMAEAVALIKANPGKFSTGHIGPGSLSQLSMEALKRSLGLDMVAVPYKGSAAAITDLMGGSIHFMSDAQTSANAQVNAGTIKALAVTTSSRSSFQPNLPTLKESGLPSLSDSDFTAWVGMLAPAKTPPAIVERLNREINAILADPEMRPSFASTFLELYPPASPADFAAFIRNELGKWDRIATDSGLKGSL